MTKKELTDRAEECLNCEYCDNCNYFNPNVACIHAFARGILDCFQNELTKEKEPAASVENCTDSSEDVSISSLPDYEDITNSKKCQVISGAQMFEFLAAMLVLRLEKGFVITEIEAYGLSCEMKFKYGDEVYGLTFTNETRADDVD